MKSSPDTPQPEIAPDTVARPPKDTHCGRMVITLHRDPNGHNAIPSVEFAPVGMFTAGLMERFIPFFSQQINIAHAAARAAAKKESV